VLELHPLLVTHRVPERGGQGPVPVGEVERLDEDVEDINRSLVGREI
jgi:hypothetical protein